MNNEQMEALVLHRFQEVWGATAADFWENHTMRLFALGWDRENFVLQWVVEQTRTYQTVGKPRNFFSIWLNKAMGRVVNRDEVFQK